MLGLAQEEADRNGLSDDRHRLRHPRMRLDPAVLGVVGHPPRGHLLGRVGHQQLGQQRTGLDPSAGRIRYNVSAPATK